MEESLTVYVGTPSNGIEAKDMVRYEMQSVQDGEFLSGIEAETIPAESAGISLAYQSYVLMLLGVIIGVLLVGRLDR